MSRPSDAPAPRVRHLRGYQETGVEDHLHALEDMNDLADSLLHFKPALLAYHVYFESFKQSSELVGGFALSL